MSPETATDPRIRPVIAPAASPQTAVSTKSGAAGTPEATSDRGGASGGNRVSDYGPGADHPTAAADLQFADLLDVINPLQHIPVISSLYRRVTGDEIGTPARILGGTLYGGPPGFLAASATALVAEVTGEAPGDRLLTAVLGPPGGEAPAEILAVAEARGEQHPPLSAHGGSGPVAAKAALAPPDPSPSATPKAHAAEQTLFAERMLSALDKYQALSATRGDPPRAKPGSLDLAL